MAPPSPAAAAAAGEADGGGRTTFEVADVVRAHQATFLRTHPTSVQQRRVLRAIRRCRTVRLGGHVEGCEACGHQRIAYNSCRNRHCPKCQGAARATWLAREQALLLPVPYFHVVFTLPHLLNPLIRVNQDRLYTLLFHAAAATLQEFAADPRHLGGQLGITMVLHTWGQTLTEHIHVHCVVTGGGLSADGTRWRRPRRRGRRPFLFPVNALSALFRGKYLAALEAARDAKQLDFVGQSAALADAPSWQRSIATLWHTKWVVYAKRPFGGPEPVLKYLSRYTHRVAIANRRLVYVGDGVVRFTYKDYRDHDRIIKEMTLQGEEFLRRLLLHVVPRGFMRIRHYGLLGNRWRQQKLARCRELLGAPPAEPPPPEPPLNPGNDGVMAAHSKAGRCPKCGGRMRVIEILAPQPFDSS